MIFCPKCGHKQPKGNTECLKCGVIFSKAITPSRSKPLPGPARAPQEPAPQKPEEPAAPRFSDEKDTIASFTSHISDQAESFISSDPPVAFDKIKYEVLFLTIVAYAVFIFGVFGGVVFIVQTEHELLITAGIAIIFQAVALSTVLFIVCFLTKSIASISRDVYAIRTLAEHHFSVATPNSRD